MLTGVHSYAHNKSSRLLGTGSPKSYKTSAFSHVSDLLGIANGSHCVSPSFFLNDLDYQILLWIFFYYRIHSELLNRKRGKKAACDRGKAATVHTFSWFGQMMFITAFISLITITRFILCKYFALISFFKISTLFRNLSQSIPTISAIPSHFHSPTWIRSYFKQPMGLITYSCFCTCICT